MGRLKREYTKSISSVTQLCPTLCDPMDDVFGEMLADTLRLAVLDMDHRLKGFAHPDALLTAVETRTSSPIRILRGDNMQAVGVCGLYPAGEGAGYAGGITSAAVDGIKVALAIIENFVTTN